MVTLITIEVLGPVFHSWSSSSTKAASTATVSDDGGDKSDSEILKTIEYEMQHMQENHQSCWMAGSEVENINDQSIGAKRLREISEESSEEGFITITRKGRKPKRLIRSDSLTEDKSLEKLEQEGTFEKKIELTDKKQVESLICCQKLIQLGIQAQLSSERIFSYGIVKGVDLDMSEKELLEAYSSSSDISAVKRLKRMDSEGNWVESETVRICFKSRSRPSCVYAFGCRFPVERYTFPVNQCSNCWKFGHIKRFCPSKNIICPKCSKNHTNCETVAYSCPNCKGSHMALDKTCIVYLREKKIRQIMGEKNISYKEAFEVFRNSEKEMRNKNVVNTNSMFTKDTIKNVDQITVPGQSITTPTRTYADVVIESVPVNHDKDQAIDKLYNRNTGNNTRKEKNKQTKDYEFLTMEIDNEATECEQKQRENDSEKQIKDKVERKKRIQLLTRKFEEIILCDKKAQPISLNNPGIEAVYAKIYNCDGLENIIAIYCPPNVRTQQDDWDSLFAVASKKTLIAGDFNGHHSNWSCKTDLRGNQLLDSSLEHGFTYLNTGDYTRIKLVSGAVQRSSPDITFTSTDLAIKFKWQVFNENLGSDHLFLKMRLNYEQQFPLN
ncbi:hypothetical protein HW555_001698 [Spodoptera exigua]|uniref:Endonuclease/exonuclease/phosphatase domain-containing protein n=1 Tax=Spodoptera exigua TaxID=7107 RepID=A0A835LA63_SPOEX|nr:hypothetical protein HW555_001698 [Spodoptera exigua]